MVKDETSERSAELLRLALPLMSKHADGFKPISYAVWYEYVAGSNSALKQEVEASIQGGNRMSSSVTFDLYRKHMIDRDEQAVNNARSGLLDVLGKMQSSVADANSQTEGFNADLEQFGRKLSETDNRDELLGNVSEMLDKAQQMGASLNELQSDFVQGQTEVQRLTEELNRMRQEVQTDPLTGLMNRRGFDGALKALTDRAQADQTELCMLMIDIDHFKKVNDSFGHLFGDQVIRGVAQAIKGLVKGQDVGARYGGEEFAVLLPNTGRSGGLAVAEAIRSLVERSKIRRNNSNEAIGNLTISIGVSSYVLAEDPQAFIERADAALYKSKEGGRNRVTAG